MASYNPPDEYLSLFNALNYLYGYDNLTLFDAQHMFLSLTGGALSGNLYAPNIFSSGSLGGTLSTASQPNVTSLGTLTGVNLNGNFNLTSGAIINNYLVWTAGNQPTNTNGVGLRFSGLQDGGTGYLRSYNYLMSSDNNLTINNGNIYIKNDRNVGIDVARASIAYKLDINGDCNVSGNFRQAGSIVTGISSSQAALLSATAGTASASKALIVDSNIDIAGIHTIGVSTASNHGITITNTNVSSLADIRFISSGMTWEQGIRGSSATYPSMWYLYSATSGMRLICDNTTGCFAINQVSFTGGYQLEVTGASRLGGNVNSSGICSITNTTDSSSTSTGALVISGGLGLSKSLYMGGFISQSSNISNQISLKNTNTLGVSNVVFECDTKKWTCGGGGSGSSWSNRFLVYNQTDSMTCFTIDTNGQTNIPITTDSSSISTGCLVVAGGVGIAKKLTVGTDCNVIGNYYQNGNLISFSALSGTPGSPSANTALILDSNAYLLNATATFDYTGILTGPCLKMGCTAAGNRLFISSNNALSIWTNSGGKSGAPTIYTSYLGGSGSIQRWVTQLSSSQQEISLDWDWTSGGLWKLYINDTTGSLNITNGADNTLGGVYLAPNRTGVGIMTTNTQNGAPLTVSSSGQSNIPGGISIGSTYVNTNALDIFNASLSAGNTYNFMKVGQAQSARNSLTHAFVYAGSGSTSNRYQFDWHGTSGNITMFADNSVSINSISTGPGRLHVAGNRNYNFASGSLYRQTWTTSSSYFDYGLAPYSAAISISCDDLILSSGMLMQSDARLKQDIKPLDFDIDTYLKLDTKSFIWKRNKASDIGFIAQDLLDTELAGLLIDAVQDKRLRGDDKIEDGFALAIKYSRVPILNHRCIKVHHRCINDMNERITSLEQIIEQQQRMLDLLISNMRETDLSQYIQQDTFYNL